MTTIGGTAATTSVVVGFIKYKGAAVIHFDDTISTAKDKKDLIFAQEVEAQIPRCLFPEFAKLGAIATKNPPGRVRRVNPPPLIEFDRGHLIRKSWGGIDDLRNIVAMPSTVNRGAGDYFRIETKVVDTINALPKPLDYITFKSTPMYDANTRNFFGKAAPASIIDLFGASNITGVEVCTDGVFHTDKVKLRPTSFDVVSAEVINNGQPMKFVDRVGNNPVPANKVALYFGPAVGNS